MNIILSVYSIFKYADDSKGASFQNTELEHGHLQWIQHSFSLKTRKIARSIETYAVNTSCWVFGHRDSFPKMFLSITSRKIKVKTVLKFDFIQTSQT